MGNGWMDGWNKGRGRTQQAFNKGGVGAWGMRREGIQGGITIWVIHGLTLLSILILLLQKNK